MDEPVDLLRPVFLPYSGQELLTHFVEVDAESEDPRRHLRAWEKRIEDAPSKDPAFLDRDETLWTAGALLAVHQGAPVWSWVKLFVDLFGSVPPVPERLEWTDLITEELQVFFEVGLSSPIRYREWLRDHLEERQPLIPQRISARARGTALEGRTHLDALLLDPATGFAVHFEAKVLSDIDTKTTHDGLRNQLVRNIDCLAAAPPDHPVLRVRRPERSLMVMLTPEFFRRHWQSRLYGHLVREYIADPAALQRDLPHLDHLTCVSLSRRIGWLTFEDLRRVEPAACPWLAEQGGEHRPN